MGDVAVCVTWMGEFMKVVYIILGIVMGYFGLTEFVYPEYDFMTSPWYVGMALIAVGAGGTVVYFYGRREKNINFCFLVKPLLTSCVGLFLFFNSWLTSILLCNILAFWLICASVPQFFELYLETDKSLKERMAVFGVSGTLILTGILCLARERVLTIDMGDLLAVVFLIYGAGLAVTGIQIKKKLK